MVVPFSQTVERYFYIREPAEYVINTSLFAIALATTLVNMDNSMVCLFVCFVKTYHIF